MLTVSSRGLAIALAVILLVVLIATIADAKGADRVDRLSTVQLERASIRAVATGGVRSSRYADATPWTKRLVRELIDRAFRGDARRWARCVVERESGWNPGAVSSTDDHGLAQLNRPSHRWVDYGRLVVDPPYAVAVMVRLSDRGHNRKPWNGGRHGC
jgi:hypothetical protein